MTLRQRQKPYRSRKWLEAVHKIECCVLCGAYGVQAAHVNRGKGMSQKQDDVLTAALCPTCHTRLDNGRDMTREERRAELDKAVVLTLQQLARMGLIEVRA